MLFLSQINLKHACTLEGEFLVGGGVKKIIGKIYENDLQIYIFI